MLGKPDIQPDHHEGNRTEQHTVAEAHARFLADKPDLLPGCQVFVRQYADGHGERLRADIARHIENQRLERHNERQARNHLLKHPDDR